MNDEQFSSPSIDATGHRWHPQAGDLVRDRETYCYGVALAVRQTANAPAYVHVALCNPAGAWVVVEVDAEQLEAEAHRARVLVAAYGERGRYDLAQREGQVAERLRMLCVAVRTIHERGGVSP